MEDFYTRSFDKRYEAFINRMCELSWTLPEQGTGYPRVESFQELYIEIQSYDNVPENCLRILVEKNKPIGFYGYLFEPGDEMAFLIGPVFLPEYHHKGIYERLIEQIEKESEAEFEKLVLSVNKSNVLFHKVISERWRKGYEEIEMNFDVQNFEGLAISHPVSRLHISDALFKDVAELLGSIDGWEDPEADLKEYMEEDDMDVAYLMEDGELLGAIMWDEMEGTDFWRLEDVAVYPEARGKGVATDLIHYVLGQAQESGAKSLFLSVEENNEHAHQLYKRLGFYETVRTCSYSCVPREVRA